MTHLHWHADQVESTAANALALLDAAPESQGIDLSAVRQYRLGRVRAEMTKREYQALILSDPVNIRYATGTRNMQIFSARNTPSRYLLITQDKTILYEFTGCSHLAEGFDTIDEVRTASTASYVAAGDAIVEVEARWAQDMLDTVCELIGVPSNSRPVIGIERMNAGAALALQGLGAQVVDAQACLEMARAIKSAEEVKCVVASLRATEKAVGLLREAIRPGITENELWSVLHQSVIAQNGDYCETRLLNSGHRTNPWFQETSSKALAANELVAFDTDVVGCHGYYSDFSRTFHVGPDKPTDAQKELYKTAYEQVHHNVGILKPGLTFKEYADLAWDIPEKFHARRYYLSAHGCGMTGEYPYLYHHADFAASGYDGVILPGMTLCVESFIGAETGGEGVKLEQQVLVTETGIEILSLFPFEDDLLN